MTLRRGRLSTKKTNTAKRSGGDNDVLTVKCITDSDVDKVVVGEEYTSEFRKSLRRTIKEDNNEADADSNKSDVSEKKNHNIRERTARHSTRKSLKRINYTERSNELDEDLNESNTIKSTSTSSKKIGKSRKVVDEVESISEEEFLHDVTEECEKPSGLCDDEDVAGDEICSFRTPKKRQGMYRKALASAGKIINSGTPKNKLTPSRSLTSSSVTTPTRKNTPKILSVVKRTPSIIATPNKSSAQKKSNSQAVKNSAQTPYNLRVRHKKDIRAHVRSIEAFDNAEDSDYHGSDDSSSDSESSDSAEKSDSSSDSGKGSEDQKPGCRRSLRFQIPTSNKKRGKDTNYVFTAEDYFVSQSAKCSTSDRRLSRLKTPRLDTSALQDLLSHCSLSHANIVADRRADDIAMFKRWMFMLSQGFSILAYGLGSKYKILQNFHKEMLSESRVMVVNGFFPSLNIKEVVEMIGRDLLGLKQVIPSSHAIIDWIESRRRMPRVFLIVHNLDADALRCEKTQRVLSRLASLPKVHLIASVDHINCPLLWDQAKLSGFNFVWEDTTSFLPYQEETSYETSLLVQNSGSLALSSLLNVYRSLTHNARGVFRIILEKHLEENNHKYAGMAFSALYKKCRDEMLVTNDVILRSILAEFLDHQMVKWRRDSEHLYIPVDTSVLQQFHKTVNDAV